MELLEKIHGEAVQLIKKVGEFQKNEQSKREIIQVETKSLNSLVSYVDKSSEQMLYEGLKGLLPDAAFLLEEETVTLDKDKEWLWIIDPLDGTTNYLHGIPFYAISVALQHKNKTVLALVYEPNRAEMFSAIAGKGCQLNGKPCFVSSSKNISDSLIATGFPYYDFEKTTAYLQTLSWFMQNSRGLRRCGAAALDLAYVACGRFDCFFEYSLAPWDVAAGALLVEEAGGRVSDFSGGDQYLFGREILATNAHINTLEIITNFFHPTNDLNSTS